MIFYDCNKKELIPEQQQILYTDLRSAHFVEVLGFELSKTGIAYAIIELVDVNKTIKIRTSEDDGLIFSNLIITSDIQDVKTKKKPEILSKYKALDPDILLAELKIAFNVPPLSRLYYMYNKNGIAIRHTKYGTSTFCTVKGFRHLRMSLGVNNDKELENIL